MSCVFLGLMGGRITVSFVFIAEGLLLERRLFYSLKSSIWAGRCGIRGDEEERRNRWVNSLMVFLLLFFVLVQFDVLLRSFIPQNPCYTVYSTTY